MPVLAHDDDSSDAPSASTGTSDTWATLTPDELAVDDLPVLVHGASTGTHAGWRVERFGPAGGDGKGRYWQWRKGRGKERTSAYGGKVGNEAAEYWHHRNAGTHGHAQGDD